MGLHTVSIYPVTLSPDYANSWLGSVLPDSAVSLYGTLAVHAPRLILFMQLDPQMNEAERNACGLSQSLV